MKKFIFKIFIILTPLLVVSIITEVSFRSIPNDYSYKNGYINNYAQDIEILVLGSSHSFYGINPEYFSLNAFNASHISQSLDFDFFILDKFENNLTSLKYVLLPISYFTLFSTLEDEEDFRIKNYVIYYGAPSARPFKYRFELLNSTYFALLKTSYQYFTRDYTNISCSILGFGLNYSNKKQEDLIKTGHAAATRHTKQSYAKFDQNKDILIRIVKKCKKHGIKLILFTPPAWDTYRENLKKEQLILMEKTNVFLTKEYSNVDYYNFLGDERFDTSDFHDADHLNNRGAKKFTLILNEILLRSETAPERNNINKTPVQGL